MRILLAALCIHGLALSPALADAVTPSSPQAPAPKGVSQQLAQAPLAGVPTIVIAGGVVVAGAVVVGVAASSNDDKATNSTTSTR
tara:strand:- start:127 stop:381 length:255 start_codon:yes stop_codon:yes gene_type:complete